jgi:hypothetical protein
LISLVRHSDRVVAAFLAQPISWTALSLSTR